jgi:hypothetical protein
MIFEFRKVGTVKKMPTVRMVLIHENGLRENLRHREQLVKLNTYRAEGRKYSILYEYCYYNKEENKFEMVEEKEAFKNKNKYVKFVPLVVEGSPDKEVRPKGLKDCEWKIYCVGFD